MKTVCCEKCGTKKFNYGVKDFRPIEHCENPDCDCHKPNPTPVKRIADKKRSMGKEIKMICNKCGKEPEIDEKKSNRNWTVYKSGDCECGGSYHFKISNAKE
jgi:hypothetical protein